MERSRRVSQISMASKKRRLRQKEEYAYLALRVERYDACIDASINRYAYAPQFAWDLDDRDPLYEFTVHLTITATSIYPEERAGETYELTLMPMMRCAHTTWPPENPFCRHSRTQRRT
jgi:hypothetical protein